MSVPQNRQLIILFSAPNLYRILAGYLVFLGGLQLLTILFSLARVVIGPPLAWVILFAAAVAGVLISRRASLLSDCPASASNSPLESRLFQLLLLLGVVVYLLIGAAMVLLPDLSCDGNTYHILPIHLWAHRGFIYWVDPEFTATVFMNGYPKGVELIGFLLGQATASTRFFTAGNWVLMPLGVLGIAFLARRLGASALASLAAGLAWMIIPVNISQSITSYVDSGFASCVVAMLALLVPACSRLQGRHLDFSAASALVLGCAAGLTIAGKTSGALFVTIGFGLFLLLSAWRLWGGAGSGSRLRGAGFLAIVISVTIVVGGFWYLRNLTLTGSPLYPAGVTVAGITIFPGPPWEQATGLQDQIPEAFQEVPRALWVPWVWSQLGNSKNRWPINIIWVDSRWGGLGFLWPIGCLPAIALLLYRAGRGRLACRRDFLWLSVLVGFFFLVQPMNEWPRFTVWIYALGLSALAVVATEIFAPAPAAAMIRAKKLWVIACLLAVTGEGLAAPTLLVYSRVVNGSVSILEYSLRTKNPWKYIIPGLRVNVFNRIFEGNETVAVNRSNSKDCCNYFLEGCLAIPIGRREIVPLKDQPDAADLAAIREQGVVFVIWDDSTPLPEVLKSLPIKRTYHISRLTVLELIPEPAHGQISR